MKPDEADLLAGAQAFDLTALAEVYDRYSPGLYGYAMRLLGDACLAEECVSETFSRFLRALKNGSGPQKHLQAYLYRVAHNWITDQYRRQPPPPLELDDDRLNGDIQDIGQVVGRRNEHEHVRAALVRLTPEQRQVIVLKFWEGWGNEVIAEAIHKPVGAVKALQHRAICALRKMLDLTEEQT